MASLSKDDVWEMVDRTNCNPLMVSYTPPLHILFLSRQQYVIVKIIYRFDWPGMMREHSI